MGMRDIPCALVWGGGGRKGVVDGRILLWANVSAHAATTKRTTAQLERSQALFPARQRKVEEVGGLFIDWPQHKHAH